MQKNPSMSLKFLPCMSNRLPLVVSKRVLGLHFKKCLIHVHFGFHLERANSTGMVIGTVIT